jgi:hypothetical protein
LPQAPDDRPLNGTYDFASLGLASLPVPPELVFVHLRDKPILKGLR